VATRPSKVMAVSATAATGGDVNPSGPDAVPVASAVAVQVEVRQHGSRWQTAAAPAAASAAPADVLSMGDGAAPSRASPTATTNGEASFSRRQRMAVRSLQSSIGKTIGADYATIASMEMDKDRVWQFKVFYLFPLLNRMQSLDHIFRVLFPLGYIVFVVVYCSEVNFGRDHFTSLLASACYHRSQ